MHCIFRGEDIDATHKTAFRKWFSYIGELRSICPSATFLALSATCTLKIRQRVLKILNMKSTDIREITLSPNRQNIKLTISKVSNEVEIAMTWLIDALNDLKENFPKTIIYCNSITDASKIYTYIIDEHSECSDVVNMFSSESTAKCKAMIIRELKDMNSKMRIVIATNALGMGIDIINCYSIVLYGAPHNVLDLVQEIGRAGRDGKDSVAMVLYNSFNLRTVEPDVKAVVTSTNCRRLAMLNAFLRESDCRQVPNKTHKCCDICANKCGCGNCTFLPLETLFRSNKLEIADHEESDSDATEPYDLSD